MTKVDVKDDVALTEVNLSRGKKRLVEVELLEGVGWEFEEE